MNPLDQRPYFFDAGIRFACRRCGACCTGSPGIVRVNAAEIGRIAAFLAIPLAEVQRRYLRPWQRGYRMQEMDDGRCVFFQSGCRIYPVRPRQCRTFPFWVSTLRSTARWQATCRECPGIGTGRRYDREEILDILSRSD